jgi:TPR repeat protein
MSEEEPIRFAHVFRGKPATFVERGADGELASLPHISPERLASVMARAAAGDVEAQLELSIFYRKGMGVEKNLELGLHWLQIAADAGFSGAQTHLGLAYMNGYDVEADRETARKWLTLATAQGSRAAEQLLRHPYFQ